MDEQKEKKFVSLVSDTTFKYLWKNVNTRDWMNDIIKDKTGIDLHDFDFIDEKHYSGNDAIKDYRSDLTLSDKKEIVIIEMNNCKSKTIEEKGRYYLYRRAGNSFDKGNEKYKEAKKVTLIMMNNYKNSLDEDCRISNSWFGDHLRGIKYDDIQMYQIYLPIYKKMCYDKCDEIDKRLWLFGAKSFKEMHDKVKNDSNLYIVEELERLSVNNAFIDEYDREAVNKKTMISLLDEGMERGKKEEKIEIAKKMLKDNMNIDLIISYTGLSREELEELI